MAPPTGYSFRSALAFDQIRARLRDELMPALEVTDWKPDERND